MVFEVKFVDGRAEVIRGVDNYQQEGPMTTFFQSDGRNYLDSWSDRVASYRTADLSYVRRILRVESH
ncbi:MAG: hypothetical protein CL458_00255 [Acidimicrobiaceae bacterium]|nr:hypothetical protein [Acidimicrobiaceae bacterium]